jgi:ABC-type transport system involved in multi-copper enzyme maturation permease subunit
MMSQGFPDHPDSTNEGQTVMAMRWGLGPVFGYEWLMTSRRWQMYAGRALFVGFLLSAMVIVWWADEERNHIGQTVQQRMARMGVEFFYALIGTQLALVILAAPAATAGSVCLDKSRGTLTHLLVTDLSNTEIILGKLAARLISVLGLIACALPVLALCILLGGVDPGAVLGAYVVTNGIAILGCSLSLTLSVWGKKTHEVMMVNYLLWMLALLAYPLLSAFDWYWNGGGTLPPWVSLTNPFWLVFAPYAQPGISTLDDTFLFLGVCLGLSVLLILTSILCVRRVAVAQASRPDRKRRARFDILRACSNALNVLIARPFGATLDRNPVLWREWQRKRPSRWMALVWAVYVFLGLVFCGMSLYVNLPNTPSNELAPITTGLLAVCGLLLVSISSVTCLAEERTRGSLDVLLTTPFPTWSIVWGKWWGAYRTIPLLAVLPTVTVWLLSVGRPGVEFHWLLIAGLILAYGAGITSLGLALATWIPRVGRAITFSVVAYVLVAVGWIFLVLCLFPRHEEAEGIASASPFFGVGVVTAEVVFRREMRFNLFFWESFWIVAYTSVAAVLYLAVLLTFDRSLGRIPASPWPAPRRSSLSRRVPRPRRIEAVVDVLPVVEPAEEIIPLAEPAEG